MTYKIKEFGQAEIENTKEIVEIRGWYINNQNKMVIIGKDMIRRSEATFGTITILHGIVLV